MSENRIYLDRERLLSLVADAPMYQKTATVTAVPAQDGEVVHTVLSDGRVETTNTAKDGDFIITNPNGERYLISARKLTARYHPTEDDGVWQANGLVRAVENPESSPITITAPWGEEQHGANDCMIAVHVTELDQPYIIDRDEFTHTYIPVL